MRKVQVISIFFGLVITTVLAVGVHYWVSLAYLTIVLNNTSRVDIYSTGNSAKIITSSKKSGEKITLVKGSYYLKFTGQNGYADSNSVISITQKYQSTISNPGYSSRHLEDLLSGDSQSISESIIASFPGINQYQVSKGRLFQEGEWYGTTLHYVGNDIFNSDTLRLIMKKTNIGWVVATDKPSVSLNRIINPDIPKVVVQLTNNLP